MSYLQRLERKERSEITIKAVESVAMPLITVSQVVACRDGNCVSFGEQGTLIRAQPQANTSDGLSNSALNDRF